MSMELCNVIEGILNHYKQVCRIQQKEGEPPNPRMHDEYEEPGANENSGQRTPPQKTTSTPIEANPLI